MTILIVPGDNWSPYVLFSNTQYHMCKYNNIYIYKRNMIKYKVHLTTFENSLTHASLSIFSYYLSIIGYPNTPLPITSVRHVQLIQVLALPYFN